jgi:phage shock protein C
MPERPLRRSPDRKMIAGVIGGLSEYFDRDPGLLRLLYVLVSVVSAGFPGIIVYVILWLVIPMRKPGELA